MVGIQLSDDEIWAFATFGLADERFASYSVRSALAADLLFARIEALPVLDQAYTHYALAYLLCRF